MRGVTKNTGLRPKRGTIMTISNSARTLALCFATALGTASLMYGSALAKPQGAGAPPATMGPGMMMDPPGMGGGGMGGGMGMRPGMGMMHPMGSAMAVDGENLYVLFGMTVYRLDKTSLEIKAHNDLMPMAHPMMAGEIRNGMMPQNGMDGTAPAKPNEDGK
jgi:hypothetical protein